MKIFRVTYHVDLLVEAKDEYEAELIGNKNLVEEIRNYSAEVYSINELKSSGELRRKEKGSFPWKSNENHEEPNMSVDEILEQINGQ